ncbi:formate dehydrogenase [Sulfurifustis variabilis]|uniref:Formate dehydrogenase n=1 Tax=Sulfurifustis variabilis TaxID=1675686 RepID=A0A1B4VAR7_9GAMM|nr:formate dehydrogenase subunit alpha [Sulfurifustis variabilis]BAU48884.1 formate dehydrogenase [Sulfurifustis variabilis]
MKLIKKQPQAPSIAGLALAASTMDRRTFLRRSGLVLGGTALAASLPMSFMKKASAKPAAEIDPKAPVKTVRTICGHCSVGCGIIAEVQNGVWTGQEPAFDHPFNLGAHCAKGASVREHGHGERRLKYPMKLVGGKWQRISWDQAINEVGDKMLALRKEFGPDSIFMTGGSKHNNEQSYLQTKFFRFWGSNNQDHQARICHSTTVAGTAAQYGYGAMTNSYNDQHNCKLMLFIGSNAAEAHPVAMQHILRGKENGAKIIVAEPRFTRTAAHADLYVRIRSGTDTAFIWGVLWHILENGWEDKEFIRSRVYGFDEVRSIVKNYTPDVVSDVTGTPKELIYKVAEMMAKNRPGTLVWCMGGTQHHHGTANVRSYNTLQLALGNTGRSGGGSNIYRGHDNVQGATDVGPNSHTLPGYYGLAEGAWKHWARVWDVDFDWLKNRFDQTEYDDGKGGKVKPMNMVGVTVSRWHDAVLEDPKNITQRSPIKMVLFWGHAPNSQSRGPNLKKAFEKLDALVIVDPYPTVSAVMHDRTDNVWLLPATTCFETYGSVTASNRALQWRDKVIDPLFESKTDEEIMYLLAKKLGFEKEMFKHIRVENNQPNLEDTLREINRGAWTIGYTGQSPERLKLHQQNWGTFNTTTTRAEGGPCNGEYYGLPWPCWGTADLKHPGTPLLYDTSKPVKEGGLNFRANWGVEKDGVSMLAGEGSHPVGAEIKEGHPEFTFGLLRKLGWDKDLTDKELDVIYRVAGINLAKGDEPDKAVQSPQSHSRKKLDLGKDMEEKLNGVNWKTDLSGGIIRVAISHGCAPFGNGRARAKVWEMPDPVPVHREPLYTPRHDLVQKFPTYPDKKVLYRLPTRYASIQAKDYSKEFPLVLTSGRLTEYEGGGDETRSNPWLAELQQDMFAEINPTDANNAGIRHGQMVWVESPEGAKIRVKALVTRRVGAGTVWCPFHFGGHFQGQDLRAKYPPGADPYVLGEAVNTVTTYGYDAVTAMQETKTTLCRVRPA